MPATLGHLDQAYRVERLEAAIGVESFRQSANLHVASIRGGLLEALGPRFLTLLYQELSKCKGVIIYVARRNEIIGFAVGSVNVIDSIKDLRFIGMMKLGLAACANVWRPSLLKKTVEAARYFFRNASGATMAATAEEAVDPGRSELLAIAVAEEWRGQGVGQSLVAALEEDLENYSDRSRYFVSADRDEIGSNAFYRATGFTLVAQRRHHKMTLNIYKKDFKR